MIRRAAVLTATVLLLAGCTAAPEAEVVPSATPTEAALPQPPVGLVATGVLDGAPFRIDWDGSTFWLSGLDTVPATDGSLIGVSTVMPVVGDCLGGYARTFAPPFGQAFDIGSAPRVRDATFFVSVSTLGPYTGSCYGQPVLSTASIDWTMTPLYPDLAVSDSGETGGAKGVVTLEGDVPVSYTVNQGDVLEEIAARLGLTTDQLVWLNPRRPDPTTVYKDETLNLSPTRR